MTGSIRRRSKNGWEITIDMGRDAQGVRHRKFVTVKGKKSDAERRLRAFLTSLDHGIPVSTDSRTLAEWLDRWIREDIGPNRRQRTTERYSDVVRKHIKPYLGHVQLTKLSPSDVKALEADWSNQGMTSNGVLYGHRVLSAALKAAV